MIEKYLVKKITEPVDWKVTVPGSKSMTNRALLMAVLSAGTVRVEGVLFSDDSRHFLACLVALGFTVEIEEEKKCVTLAGMVEAHAARHGKQVVSAVIPVRKHA